ncbi:MAG: hypothetical protein M1819_004262 [Sarea resinae]|nr:MAG: hypothetical protein M1819_004262 [Sarea resinae]
MVLYKRKPVQYVPQPSIEDEDVDVWVIGQTGEIFTRYEDYLQRMDFYKQKRFICEITGRSSLTFFDALDLEESHASDVDFYFPDALKEPILRKVQFSTVSRIDSLVDQLFEEFRLDFYPGENVTVFLDSGKRLKGIIRDKAKFPELLKSDGTVERKAFARYFVKLMNRPHEEALVDDEHIQRDRKTFTKQILRSFIKTTVTREAWTGAPWIVKEKVARDLRIDTEVPPNLRQKPDVPEKKASQVSKKGEHGGAVLHFQSVPAKLPQLKPASNSHKSKLTQQQIARNKQEQYAEYQRALKGSPGFGDVPQTNGSAKFVHYDNHTNGFPPIAAKGSPKPPPPPPIKYPIEDLEIRPLRDGTHRPVLKFLSSGSATTNKKARASSHGLRMELVGPALETWNTLNVFCEIFVLDSFTFDDFLECLQIFSEDLACELFVEIHCAVLKLLVDEDGKVMISLPDMPEEESEEEESENDTSAIPTPTPEPEVPVGRTTRSSLAKSEAAQLRAQATRSRSSSIDTKNHMAPEMLGDVGWVERLKNRDFSNGGWQTIIVGLLYQLSLDPRHKKPCEEILAQLAPLDDDPSQATAKMNYASMDVNLRVKALQIICLLTMQTKVVRSYMEECAESMTAFRKEKIVWQRARKDAMEELRVLDEERKQLLPEPEETPQPAEEASPDVTMVDADGTEEEEIPDTEDEEPHTGRSLRRANDRAAERKRKRDEEKAKKEKAEAAAKQPKLSPHVKKVLKDIEKKKERIKECEDQVAVLDNDLREADCFRTRVLGKDRFWNRYYWFERNGMPYGGLPNSSTADADYANGCLWVQGPDDMEREGFIEIPEEDNKRYRKAFGCSVNERKKLEEGSTNVFTAMQWGYYDDPDSLDMLIGWLDARGNRELKLRKELQVQREKITHHMKKRKEYLTTAEEKKKAKAAPEDGPPTRMSTRTKTYVDPAEHRCLAWKNTTAMEEIGHLHSEEARRVAKKVSSKKKGEVPARETRAAATKKQGKGVGRQGTRHTL